MGLQNKVIQNVKYGLLRRIAYWCALRIASLFFLFDKRGRNAVMENYKVVMQHQGLDASRIKLRKMAHSNFKLFAKHLVDFFTYSGLSRETIKDLISFEQYQNFLDVYNEGKGVILITAHIGNWELGGAVLSSLGFKINAVFLPEKVRWLNRIFFMMRRSRGLNVFPLGGAVRSVLGSLKNGGIVAMLADRDYTAHHIKISFFGKEACLSSGPVRIALKTNIPIVAGFLLREKDDTFRMRFYPPIRPEHGMTELDLLKKIANILEKEISTNLEQWFMFDSFWK